MGEPYKSPSSYDLAQEAKELVRSEDAICGVVVGNDVYDPLLFAPKVIRFSAKEYQFLHSYRLGIPLAEAALKVGMAIKSAEHFLQKPSTMAWLEDRALKDHIKNEWNEPSKWWAEMDHLYASEEVPKHKLEILREFGDRVCPKTSRNAELHSSPKIEIHINPAAVQQAFDRQQAINQRIQEELGQ